MRNKNDLKGLFTGLKEIKIKEYLYSKDFQYFAINNNIEGAWTYYKKKVTENSGADTAEGYEEAFFLILSRWYEDEYFDFHEFILPVLLNFSKWKNIKVDFTDVTTVLKKIDIPNEKIRQFINELKVIEERKPLTIIFKNINRKA